MLRNDGCVLNYREKQSAVRGEDRKGGREDQERPPPLANRRRRSKKRPHRFILFSMRGPDGSQDRAGIGSARLGGKS